MKLCKKKSSKMMRKKFRDQKRKNGWKRNSEPENEYPSFNETYILEGEAPQISFITEYDERLTSEFGVTDELCTTAGNLSINIPEELLIEVLSRLPLKSISRFKCVSKQWQHMILNNVSVKNPPKLLILSREGNNSFSFRSLDNEIRVKRICSPIEEALLRGYGHTVKAHSSCHGLLLIQIDDSLFVWNPLTKFFKRVLTQYTLADRDYLMDLCFDSSSDEYKVVIVENSYDGYSEIFHLATCGTNRWEIIDVPGDINFLSSGPFFKGYRHWICKRRSPTSDELSNNSFIPSPQHIVYLDLSSNKFIEVPTPKPKRDDHNILIRDFLGLGVIDGCLCVTRWFRSWGSNIECLVMKEYMNENSWEVIFVFSNLPDNFCDCAMEPLFKTKEGELVLNMNLCYNRNRGVMAYDVNRKFLWDIFSWTRNGSNYDAVLYEESCYDCEHFFSNSGDLDFPSIFSDYDYYLDIFSDFWTDGWGNDREDLYDIEYSNFDQWEFEDIVEVEFLSRLNSWNKKMKKKKKVKYVKIATKRATKYRSRHALVEIQRRKEKQKGNKGSYRSKCRSIIIHDITL